jgi:hypothetical protein
MRFRKRRNPGFDADHVQMFPGGGRVEVWNDGEVCVFDPMDRDLDDYHIVPGDVPKLLRLMAEPLARWHHFMRDMVRDDVSLLKRRRRNPSSLRSRIQAIINKRGGSSGRKSMSRLRRRSKARRSTRKVSRKARRAARKAAWRKAQAKRLAKLRARKAKKSRKGRKTGRRAVRRTTRRTVRRTRRVRRTSRKTARRSSRKSRRYSRRARR